MASSADRDAQPPLEEAEVFAALEHVLASSAFASSPRSSALLRFLVEQSLTERAYPLKEREIARAVLGADGSFDPATNSAVRVQGRRVRNRLEQYYATEGAAATIRIDIPRGGYLVAISTRPDAVDGQNPSVGRTSARIAVARFAVAPASPELEALAIGIAERLVHDLRRLPSCEVIGPVSPSLDGARSLAERHDAHVSVEGSVRDAGDTIRITARLVEFEHGVVLWSEAYERHADVDILAIEEDIAHRTAAVVSELGGAIHRVASTGRVGPSALTVHRALGGFYAFLAVPDLARWPAVVADLEAALVEEPDHPSLLWALGGMLSLGPDGGHRDETGRGLELVRRGYAADPNAPMAMLAFASTSWGRGEPEEAADWALRAAKEAPHHPTVLYNACGWLFMANRWDEGLELLDEAMDLMPGHPSYWHFFRGLDALRRQEWKTVLSIGRTFDFPLPPWGALMRACGLLGTGDREGALAELAVARAQVPAFADDPRGVLGVLNPGWADLVLVPLAPLLDAG